MPELIFCWKCRGIFSTMEDLGQHERDEPDCSPPDSNPYQEPT
jgi:hypothetical protein